MMQKKAILFTLLLFYSFIVQAQNYLISDGGTVNTCGGTIYDSGGSTGAYGNDEDYIMTFCPDTPDECLVLEIELFQTESFFDYLTIYDGDDISAPILTELTGFPPSSQVWSSNGCLTLQFISGTFITNMGFEIGVSCNACPTCDDGVMNGSETGVDCGGPDCEPCPCSNSEITELPFSESGSTCGFGGTNQMLCNSFLSSGENYIYTYTPAQDECIFIDLENVSSDVGLFVSSECPTDFTTTCITQLNPVWGETSISGIIQAEAGVTYYFAVSSSQWALPCTDFDLSLSNDCPELGAGDCLGAIPVCDGFYDEAEAPTGEGFIIDEINTWTSCLTGGELNSGWYQITIASDGFLSFTLTPNDIDDYDWSLFNLTDASCSDILTDPSIEVSCNSYGLVGVNGPTGISTADGGTGNSNGPGDLNGPPFNADVPVLAGETYVLMVSNWSGTPNGYTLDFTNSTAGFFDAVEPDIEVVTASCSEVVVTFTEPILCSTVELSDFTMSGDGGPFTATSITSNCSFGANSSISFAVIFDPPFPSTGGDYNLIFDTGDVEDLCGNPIDDTDFDFTVPEGMEVTATSSPASCSAANGEIEVISVEGGTAPYEYNVGSGFQSSAVFTGLLGGDYIVQVRDAVNCLVQIDVTVDQVTTDFTAGDDAVSCNLNYGLQAVLPPNSSGVWSGNALVSFSDVNSPNTSVTVTDPGTYTLSWTVTNELDCEASDIVEVSFSDLSLNMVLTPASCPESCDGAATANVSGAMPGSVINYNWSAGSSSSNSATNLCPVPYSLSISDDIGCETSIPFSIIVPDTLRIEEIIETAETCANYCDGSLEIISNGAVDFSFDGGETFLSSSTISSLCSGNYNIVVRNAKGCVASAAAFLTEPVSPVSSFLPQNKTASIYSPTFEFHNLSRNYTEHLWQFGYPETMFSTIDEDMIYTIPDSDPQPGKYSVLLTVTNDVGCADSSLQTVELIEELLSFIPNTFTPNGDGINDSFKPVLINVDPDQYQLDIFDRFGKIIFSTNNLNEGWNGRSTDENDYYAPNGTYNYRIKAHSINTAENVLWEGFINLIR